MSLEETLCALTANAAHVLGRGDRKGRLAAGTFRQPSASKPMPLTSVGHSA